jgi:hypothetical protein
MVKHTVMVELPETLFEPFQKIAQAKSQTVEQLVLDQLRSVLSIPLPHLDSDEETELIAFKFLSEDTLRGIAREQMSGILQERMQVLMTRNNFGTITDDEYRELEALVERGQRLTLRKAWAAGVLMERGHKITAKDMSPEDE